MTRFYQPIDVSINKPFKIALREKYINFCIDFGANNIKINHSNMIKFICDTWNSDIVISKEIIWKSFKVTGLTNKFDHSEDSLFKAWSNMEKEVPLIEDDLENDYNFDGKIEVPDDDD